MFGFPASTVYAFANSFYIGAAAIAAICSLLIYSSAAMVLKEEKAEFDAYKRGAEIQVAAAYAEGVKAGREASEAKTAAAEANARAAESNAKAAEANARAETAVAQGLETKLELAKRIGQRMLTDAEKDIITKSLSSFEKKTFFVEAGMNDGEAYEFANSIRSFLKEIGFNTEYDNRSHSLIVYGGIGLSLVMHDAEDADNRINTIRHAFSSAGIDLKEYIDSTAVKKGELGIYVGSRF